jgi:hypothetical protein
MITDVFFYQKRVNVCEHMVKIAPKDQKFAVLNLLDTRIFSRSSRKETKQRFSDQLKKANPDKNRSLSKFSLAFSCHSNNLITA